MKKAIFLFLAIFFIVFNQAYSYSISYNGIKFDSRDIEKLTTVDSAIFLKIVNEYTGYGTELVSVMIPLYGTPYKYGGHTKLGIDCSAFTQEVYSGIDYIIPRTAKEQSELGEYIDNKSLQAGDLLFFGRGKYITHVGIYLIDGYFIHASTRNNAVCIQKLDTKYYDTFYAFAKRV